MLKSRNKTTTMKTPREILTFDDDYITHIEERNTKKRVGTEITDYVWRKY